MWRWLNWAARILVTAVLLSFLSIWTTGYIVNSYMETLLKQFNLPLETQPFALSGIWGTLWGASPVPQAKDESNEADESNGNPVLNLIIPQQSNATENSQSQEGDGDVGEAPADGLSSDMPVEASPDPLSPLGEDDAAPVFGGEESTSAVTDEQRQVMNKIMSKLNGEQLSELSGYLEDGLTEDELNAIRELLKPKLTTTEYAKMMEILEPRVAKPEESTDSSSESSVRPPEDMP